jgi:Kdo2-lipid IVA lauroyltransferase/acyltransferase
VQTKAEGGANGTSDQVADSPALSKSKPSIGDRLQYWPVVWFVRLIGVLPRPLAHGVGILIGGLVYYLHPRLRRAGARNLAMAFPEKSPAERRKILRGVYVSLGRLLGEACLFPTYTRKNASEVAVYQGFENFEAAEKRGKGVLLLTAHLGGWEVGSFFHSLQGHPMHIVVRPLDNPLVDALVTHYRGLHGNTMIGKKEFARGLITAMRRNQTVGILMDTNMTPPQGVFVDFFGIPACSASGLARIALHSDATVVPAFTIWDSVLRKYRVEFDRPLELVRTGNDEADAEANTARFTKAIEQYIRRYPDQWLWVHRRWKTRPAGQPPLY